MNLAQKGQYIKLNHPVEIMRFTLVYDGSLPAQTSHDSRIEAKHAIRKELHTQLTALWNTKPMLAGHLAAWKKLPPENQLLSEPHRDCFILPFARGGGFHFVPLVNAKFKLLCELDILFLRAEPPGSLFTTNRAGDLDNRLKVLFDALRVPQEDQELPATVRPDSTEQPLFYCLLENDNLITSVRLDSQRLYGPPQQRDRVRLVINATIKAQEFWPAPQLTRSYK